MYYAKTDDHSFRKKIYYIVGTNVKLKKNPKPWEGLSS